MNQFNQNQLTNQMQGMNLGGPRQYPGKGVDNGPHMPPPLSQQQQSMLNGQQMRSPGPGYPSMPGQMPSGPGAYPQAGYQQQQTRRLDPDQMPSPVSFAGYLLILALQWLCFWIDSSYAR